MLLVEVSQEIVRAGDLATHKYRDLDSRAVAEVSGDRTMIKLEIFGIATEWLPAENYIYERWEN